MRDDVVSLFSGLGGVLFKSLLEIARDLCRAGYWICLGLLAFKITVWVLG